MAFLIEVLLLFSLIQAALSLSPQYYESTCPNVESIVRSVSERRFQQLTNHPAQVIRLFFHDCFVQGCDGSILVSSTDGNEAERDADVNLSLPGDAFVTVELAKSAVEEQCPGLVSCADILAILTRDLVSLAGGPTWILTLGRLDGRVSRAELTNDIPQPSFDITQLETSFDNKGLSMVDLVSLSGSHTLGVSHCSEFKSRLYNFSQNSSTDPSMDPSFASGLMQQCPLDTRSNDPIVLFDPSAPFSFDNNYYKDLQSDRGLLGSDQAIFSGSWLSRAIVDVFAANETMFFDSFATSMDRLSRVELKTGDEGEIRKVCSRIN